MAGTYHCKVIKQTKRGGKPFCHHLYSLKSGLEPCFRSGCQGSHVGLLTGHREQLLPAKAAWLQGFLHQKVFKVKPGESKQVNVTCKFSGVFPLPSVKLTWGSFDLFADKMTATVNPSSSCYEVTIHKVGPENFTLACILSMLFCDPRFRGFVLTLYES